MSEEPGVDAVFAQVAEIRRQTHPPAVDADTETHEGSRPLQGWFNFEGRCMVCGLKVLPRVGSPFWEHIEEHRKDGYIERSRGAGERFYLYRQVKAHPAGFPGILLPQWMQWTR